MCSDFKSPMLQVLSNTSLKVFFSTTPNFCLGVYGPSPPRPPPQLRRLRYSPSSSQKVRNAAFWHSARLFALLQMPSLQNLKKFWVPSPFKPNIFSFDPPLKHVFFHGPPSNPTSNPPYLIILERSLRRFILLIRYCIHETKLQQHLLLLILLIIN